MSTEIGAGLVHTGITPGKCLVVLAGQKKAMVMAICNNRGRRRWPELRELSMPPVAGG